MFVQIVDIFVVSTLCAALRVATFIIFIVSVGVIIIRLIIQANYIVDGWTRVHGD